MTEVQWLNEDEMRLWRAFLEASSRVLQQVEADMKAAADLTFDDYEVLVHLSETPGRRLRMAELSERLLHSRSRLTQRVDRMTKRGLIEREKCPNDGRGTFAVLTDTGLEAIASAAPDHLVSVRRALIDIVSPGDIAVLADRLESIVAASETATPKPAPLRPGSN
ncbi:MAG: MarR family transcriptional regulator [Actinobacteria bacterium]|nr:MarR family transcriptional regulator [Actinomycetota bacterium]